MKLNITFSIHYHTTWGQQIALKVNFPTSNSNNQTAITPLQYTYDGEWRGTIDLESLTENFNYKYVLIDENTGIIEEEWGSDRIQNLSNKHPKNHFVKDTWRGKGHPDIPLYTGPFLAVLFNPQQFPSKAISREKDNTQLTFQIRMPRVLPHQRLCVVGNIEALGNWQSTKPFLLTNEAYPLWSGTIDAPSISHLEYKYGIYDLAQQEVVFLEKGPNRRFDFAVFPPSQSIFLNDEYFKHPGGNWKGTGLALPVFSIRSKKGFGIGEFTDLPLLVDWAEQMGMRMVQILPINDTCATFTWTDSYPYATISVFALHPVYLNLESLDGFDAVINRRTYNRERKKLNALAEIDYEKVLSLKLKYAKQLFEAQATEFLKSIAFKKFRKENQHWLDAYAIFCYLRDKYNSVNFANWGADRTFSEKLQKKCTSTKFKDFHQVAFYFYLQFQLDKQLKAAANYARSRQIILKGDIPIGIYRYSVDAWVAPELYNMNGQAGAPPDPFSEIGQNWGFPTYNWEVMVQDGYQWWKNRLQQLTRYFDTFRIDHILGFFRIWEIPLAQIEGSFGVFNKALPIHLYEFEQRGIAFNYERFCVPYIPEHLVFMLFKRDGVAVIQTFLKEKETGFFEFLPEFDTQRKIENWFNQTENQDKIHWKKGLFQLHSNVLFFEEADSNGTLFHPRIEFLKINSYQELDNDTRHKLSELYLHYFYERQDDFWEAQANIKLPAIKSATNMLICGEDLGMVPTCVPKVMEEMEILTLEIQRMSKKPATEFLQLADIPYWSVCSPSTHDMSPIRLWWEEMDAEQRQRFCQQELNHLGTPSPTLTPYLAKLILQQHLNFPSMWAVFPLQDLLAMSEALRRENSAEERINVPANPKHYWRYRMHWGVEELLKEKGFIEEVRGMILVAGR